MEKTPWFDPTEPPVRAGVYEREWSSDISDPFDYWDGADWYYGGSGPKINPNPWRGKNDRRWRGLTAPAE